MVLVAFFFAVGYASSRTGLEHFLSGEGLQADWIPRIVSSSIREMWTFALMLTLGVGLLWGILSGKFAGPRSWCGWGMLALLLVTDLVRANAPWIVHYDYQQRYSAAPLWQQLKQGLPPQRVLTDCLDWWSFKVPCLERAC